MFYIKDIELKHFRCYKEAKFTFTPHKNIIFGNNASGKTSLVEAIYYLGLGKTFKNIKDIDLINKNKEYTQIKALIMDVDGSNSVSIAFDGKTKTVKKNNKLYKTLSEYLGYFNTVVFSPDDLELIKGSPNERRRFLDINVAQIDKTYLNSLIDYRKILKERNELLKNGEMLTNLQLLDVMDATLIDKSRIIIEKRREFINKLNLFLEKINLTLSSQKEKLEMIYLPNCPADALERKAKERRQYDISLNQTTWGPNRDDVSFLINGQNADVFASQGQIRTASLSLKLALAEIFRAISENMLIILDDVFSELDLNRQKMVLKLLESKNQTFITTTTVDHIDKDLLANSNLIEIRGENNE